MSIYMMGFLYLSYQCSDWSQLEEKQCYFYL